MSDQRQEGVQAGPERIAGLDAIRFICALIVVLAHTGRPPLTAWADTSTWFGWFIDGSAGLLFSSAAAVIVFFVISGFCIHYPFARTLKIPSVAGYLPRRYLRIVVPVIIATWLGSYVGIGLRLFNGTILWSLAAELIYYTLYPLLLLLRRRVGSWIPPLIASFAAALLLVALHPDAKEYPSFGLEFNWLLGLPCWLAGCALADRVAAGKFAPSLKNIWPLRLAVWAAMTLCMALRFHSPIGYPWSLNFFALFAAVWLAFEISRFFTHKPSRILESLGLWSYSLYLTHKASAALYAKLGIPDFGVYLTWALRLAFILALAYLFYLVVEKPAHWLARTVGRSLDKVQFRFRPAPAAPPE